MSPEDHWRHSHKLEPDAEQGGDCDPVAAPKTELLSGMR